MEAIKAINIQELGLNLEKIGDFLYHEGPLLSLFKDRHNTDNYYFYKWADCDELCNRWLVFPVSTEMLRAFLYKEISLRSLLVKNSYLFLVDLNNDLQPEQYLIAASNDIPNSYLPSENSFYKEEKYTELANSFKETVTRGSIHDVLNYLLGEVDYIKKEQKREISLIAQLLDSSNLRASAQIVA